MKFERCWQQRRVSWENFLPKQAPRRCFALLSAHFQVAATQSVSERGDEWRLVRCILAVADQGYFCSSLVARHRLASFSVSCSFRIPFVSQWIFQFWAFAYYQFEKSRTPQNQMSENAKSVSLSPILPISFISITLAWDDKIKNRWPVGGDQSPLPVFSTRKLSGANQVFRWVGVWDCRRRHLCPSMFGLQRVGSFLWSLSDRKGVVGDSWDAAFSMSMLFTFSLLLFADQVVSFFDLVLCCTSASMSTLPPSHLCHFCHREGLLSCTGADCARRITSVISSKHFSSAIITNLKCPFPKNYLSLAPSLRISVELISRVANCLEKSFPFEPEIVPCGWMSGYKIEWINIQDPWLYWTSMALETTAMTLYELSSPFRPDMTLADNPPENLERHYFYKALRQVKAIKLSSMSSPVLSLLRPLSVLSSYFWSAFPLFLSWWTCVWILLEWFPGRKHWIGCWELGVGYAGNHERTSTAFGQLWRKHTPCKSHEHIDLVLFSGKFSFIALHLQPIPGILRKPSFCDGRQDGSQSDTDMNGKGAVVGQGRRQTIGGTFFYQKNFFLAIRIHWIFFFSCFLGEASLTDILGQAIPPGNIRNMGPGLAGSAPHHVGFVDQSMHSEYSFQSQNGSDGYSSCGSGQQVSIKFTGDPNFWD